MEHRDASILDHQVEGWIQVRRVEADACVKPQHPREISKNLLKGKYKKDVSLSSLVAWIYHACRSYQHRKISFLFLFLETRFISVPVVHMPDNVCAIAHTVFKNDAGYMHALYIVKLSLVLRHIKI
jgi:hypothetical protein